MTVKTYIHIILFLLAGLVLNIPMAFSFQKQLGESAAPTSTGRTQRVPDQDQLDDLIAEVQKEIAAAQEAENEGTALSFGVNASQLKEQTGLLREIEGTYQRQITALKRQKSLQNEQENLDKELATKQEMLFSRPPPYNLSTYDGLLDQLATQVKQEQTAHLALKANRKTLEETKTRFEETGHGVREAREQLQAHPDDGNGLILNWNLEQKELDNELARASLQLQRLNMENAEKELRLVQLNKEILERHAAFVHQNLAYDQDDLDRNLQMLEEKRTTLIDRIETLRREQQDVERTWLAAREELDRLQNEADETLKRRAVAYLRAREAWRETYQNVLEQTENVLLFLNHAEQVWQRRYALLADNFTIEQLGNWRQETKNQLESIGRLIGVKTNYQEKLQAEIASIQKQLADEEDEGLKEHLTTHVAAMTKMAERNFEYQTLLNNALAVEQRFLDEIDLIMKNGAFEGKLIDLGATLRDLWDYELWVVDERSVTVKKVTMALLILVLGMIIARLLARTAIRRFLNRAGFDDSATAAVEHLLTFLALLILVIFALNSVNIPLTVFTFLGGAIAIGVGFGAQNLLNNFISGFILLAERPVKINDMIEVEDNFGIIEKIGMRCTRVRTPGNTHILVPNSSFLEKNIINWTLSDQEIRGSVSLGVGHHSDTRQVTDLMLRAVREQEKVLDHPEPVVLFEEVGDSALTFVVYFWFSMKNLYLLEQRIIESNVRHRIIELFRQAGIMIAHPQSDVHLHPAEPPEAYLEK